MARNVSLNDIKKHDNRAAKPVEEPAIERQHKTGREGLVNITGYFDKAVKRQLKEIGLETGDTTIQDLIGEALNLLFAKYGKPELALKKFKN